MLTARNIATPVGAGFSPPTNTKQPNSDCTKDGRGKPRPYIFLFVLFAICRPSFAADPAAEASQHFQQGLAYERLGRIDDAYTELQLASNLDSSSAAIALALGLVASRTGNIEVAQRALEQSISIEANSVASYHLLALIYEKEGQTDRALDAWHRFAQLNQDEMLREQAKKHIQYLESL
jgi:tetratricopeptide (TPR) repeat protein